MNIKFKKLVLISGIALLSTASIAERGNMERQDRGGRHGPPPFCVMDLDKDGVITQDEYDQLQSQKIDNANSSNRKGRRGPPAFCVLDLDANGSITLEEFKQHITRREDPETIFGMIDTNGDGMITEQELLDHKPVRKGKSQKRQNS